MGKNIVICCDGTGNDEDDKTHVYRVSEAAREAPKHKQAVFYDSGVGTKFSKLLAMGFGAGLSRNVRDGYRFLAKNYQPGDDVFVFGFSRGAYTARSLVSWISRFGVLSSKAWWLWFNRKVYNVYDAYRWRDHERGALLRERIDKYRFNDVPIHGLGVWDTVGSVGVGDLDRDEGDDGHWYHDMRLPDSVRHACHALALDERRGDYTPSPWTDDECARDNVAQQWFAGVHSDVGGGYDDKTLGNVAYHWVLEQMEAKGLILPDGYVNEIQADARGPIHDSIGDSKLRKLWERRPIGDRTAPPQDALHDSVQTRMNEGPHTPHPTLEPNGQYIPVPFQPGDGA